MTMDDPKFSIDRFMNDREGFDRDMTLNALRTLVVIAKGQGEGKSSKTAQKGSTKKLVSGGWVTQEELDSLPVDEIMQTLTARLSR
jgi:hypothetical protein